MKISIAVQLLVGCATAEYAGKSGSSGGWERAFDGFIGLAVTVSVVELEGLVFGCLIIDDRCLLCSRQVLRLFGLAGGVGDVYPRLSLS